MDSRSTARTELHVPRKQTRSSATLLPIMASVFVAFVVIGVAIPVLPLHVHQGLGLGTFLVGLVAGSQFAAAICRASGQAGMPTFGAPSTPSSQG
jgi:hypothetical protein